MTTRTKSYLLIAAILMLVTATSLCSRTGSKGGEYNQLQGMVYNTLYHVTYEDVTDWSDSITALFAEVDHSLSMFNPESVISRFNRGDTGCVADSHFRRVFEVGQQVSQVTDGAFDMTVAPLVNLWGFGFKDSANVTPQAIDSALLCVGWQTVSLDSAGHFHKLHAETILDASSIAKGYAVDVVAAFLRRHGVVNYMVEIGGEVAVNGVNRMGQPWSVGIAKPKEDPTSVSTDLQSIVRLSYGALATSGNYRNFYYKDGQRYAHTIDPHTGWPVQQDILSATVFATDCMTADAYATAFMVLGSERARAVLEAVPALRAYFILAGPDGDYVTLSFPDDWIQ